MNRPGKLTVPHNCSREARAASGWIASIPRRADAGSFRGESRATRAPAGRRVTQQTAFVLALDEGITSKTVCKCGRCSPTAQSRSFARAVSTCPRSSSSKATGIYVKIGGASPTSVRLTTDAGGWDPVILGSTHTTSRWRIISQPDIADVRGLKGQAYRLLRRRRRDPPRGDQASPRRSAGPRDSIGRCSAKR